MKRASPRKPSTAAAARERLASWIASRGLKTTRQRDLIVDTFFSQSGHLSVDELVDKAKQRDPSIGAATVYRTMKILADAGLASARHFEGGQTRYEAALDRHHHDHLICTSCGNIVEFENDRIEVITGVNLPMLVRAFTYRMKGMDTLIKKAVSGGCEGVLQFETAPVYAPARS